MNYFVLFIFTLLALLVFNCDTKVTSQNSSIQTNQILEPENKIEESELLDDYFVKEDSLSLNDYNIVKLKKKIKLEYPLEMKSAPISVEVSYAILKKRNKSLKVFDGVYSGAGNATDFGLFPFLGKDSKQLAVSQTVPRGGRHWIIDLNSNTRVIFDSRDYEVGREEFSVVDLDKDGTYEIYFPVTKFYPFENLAMAEIPLPTVIFKYDETVKKYLPANRKFQDYLLDGIDEEIKKLDKDSNGYLSNRLKIVLRYIYAGKKKEAWEFFDKEYNLSNKEKIRTEIKFILKNEKIYQNIYKTEN